MNKTDRIIAFIILGLWAIVSVSCRDNDNWSPGPQMPSENPGIYFDKSNPEAFEMEVDGDNKLTKDYVTITLTRDKAKAGPALQVPVKVISADTNLVIPQTVEFAAGSSTAELKIVMTKYEGKPSDFLIEIDENKYFNQYTSEGYYQYKGQIKVLVTLTATFTPTDDSGTPKPGFVPFEQIIYDNQDGTYKIENFLLNNAGYDFSFSVDANMNIIPAISNGYHSASESRWYFYSANVDKSENRIPCHIWGQGASEYITYIYFYTAENTSSYQAFWFNSTSKTGRMMGYARYSVTSIPSGRVAFNISW